MDAISSPAHRVDGFLLPLCSLKRARSCRLFRGDAAYGHCAAKAMTYYGFQGVLIVSNVGVVTGYTVIAVNHDEANGIYKCSSGQIGVLESYKGFIRPLHRDELNRLELDLQTPLRRHMKDERPSEQVAALMKDRRLVETVIGQLTE